MTTTNNLTHDIICPFMGKPCLKVRCPFWNYKNDSCLLVKSAVATINISNILRGVYDNDKERQQS